MSIRNYQSGAKKRKTTAEKLARHEQIIQQTSRIDTFTSPVSLNQNILVSSAETHDPLEVSNSQTSQIFDDQVEEELHPYDPLSLTDLTLTELVPKGDTTTTRLISAYETDLGLWKNISADMQAYFIMRGSVECQYIDDDLLNLSKSIKINTASARLLYLHVSTHLLLKNRIELGCAIHLLQVISTALYVSFYQQT